MKTLDDPKRFYEPSVDDPDAPATEEELREAEALREALADSSVAHEPADFLRAVALAHDPRPLDEAEHRAIVERALAKKDSGNGSRGNVIRVVFGAGGALALAAGLALVATQFLAARSHESAPAPSARAVQLVPARSTQALFQEPFATTGGTSARIDRIAMARASDLRANRFALRGVR